MMTTSADDVEITYEGEALTFGGFASADFFIERAGHPGVEVNLALASDAQLLFEQPGAALEAASIQGILRALAGRVYRTYIDAGREPPAILMLRAADIDATVVDAIRSEAALP